jgi:hypothetical protein
MVAGCPTSVSEPLTRGRELPETDTKARDDDDKTPIANALQKLANSNESLSVATLTAAIVTARGKPISIKEVLQLSRDIRFALHPAPNNNNYKEWQKNKAERLSKVHD